VFRDLAMAIYRMTPQTATPASGYWADGIHQAHTQAQRSLSQQRQAAVEALEAGRMPNLSGWSAADAITLLEEHGYRIRLHGHGRVQRVTRQDKTIELHLG